MGGARLQELRQRGAPSSAGRRARATARRRRVPEAGLRGGRRGRTVGSCLVSDALVELKRRLEQIQSLGAISSLLVWDQRTIMPPAGASSRGSHLAMLQELGHEALIDPEVGRLIEELRPLEDSLDPDSDDASLIRLARREYDKAVRVPAELAGEMARAALRVCGDLARGEDDVELRALPAGARARRRAATPLHRLLRPDRRAVRHPARRLRAGDEVGGRDADLRRDQGGADSADRRAAGARGRRLVPHRGLPDRAADRARRGDRRPVRAPSRLVAHRPDGASVRLGRRHRRHPRDDALLPGLVRVAVLDDARVRARALPAPDPPRHRAPADRLLVLPRHPRVAEPALGEPRRPQHAVLAVLLPAPAELLP